MNYSQLARLVLLRDAYEKMSDAEKVAFTTQYMQNDKSQEVLHALQAQKAQLDDIQQHVDKNHWLSDFGANVAGNAAYSAAVWLLGRLLRP